MKFGIREVVVIAALTVGITAAGCSAITWAGAEAARSELPRILNGCGLPAPAGEILPAAPRRTAELPPASLS